jgi:hypothetical protein
MNGAITGFVNSAGLSSISESSRLTLMQSQRQPGFTRGAYSAPSVTLASIKPTAFLGGAKLGRHAQGSTCDFLLRRPSYRTDIRCLAVPPSSSGDDPTSEIHHDASRSELVSEQVNEHKDGRLNDESTTQVDSVSERGTRAAKQSGKFGQNFFKPLLHMPDSIRGQFQALTHFNASFNQEDAPEYGRAMANHLPMALSALRQLGAGAETCAAFESAYRQRTPLKNLTGQKTRLWGDPAMVFGRRDHFVALRNTFQAYQEAHGTKALLNLWVPKLAQGLSASAFHAVIRLGYAITDNEPSEIVNALAFWASAYQSLGALDSHLAENPEGDSKMQEIFDALAADTDLGHQHLMSQGIANRLGRVARIPGYERLIEMINQSGKFTLSDLRSQSLNLFLHQPSFTTLHLVTGAEGLAKVADKIAAPQSLLQHYALALGNVYVSRGTPTLNQTNKIKEFVRHNPQPDWPFLRSQAIESGDEHKIKFVATCQSEFERTGDYRYPLAAGVWITGKQPWREGGA